MPPEEPGSAASDQQDFLSDDAADQLLKQARTSSYPSLRRPDPKKIKTGQGPVAAELKETKEAQGEALAESSGEEAQSVDESDS